MSTEVLVFIALLILALLASALWQQRKPAPSPARLEREEPKPSLPDATTVAAPELPAPLDDVAPAPAVEVVQVFPPPEPEPATVEPRPAGTPRYPVVLAHGLMGFDSIGLGKLRQDYFRGIPGRLRALGVDVHVLRVPPFAAIRRRAEHLAQQIEQLPAERVNIIAHSMGGLDARYAISQLGLASRVASLTTIGTPHHGTPLATAGALLLRAPKRLLDSMGLDGVYDLTPQSMRQFNQVVLDAPGVHYASCVGSIGAQRFQLFGDGLVPCDSQRWGVVLREIEADHWAQIGWSARFDAAGFYAEIVRMLAERGL